MRVVIVGASGNAGTALLRRLGREDDLDVVGVVRRIPPAGQPPYDVAAWHSCDIGAPDARTTLRTVFNGADAVVHLGWQIQPSHDQRALHRTNVIGSQAVIDAVTDAGVPALVYASSIGAYAPAPKGRAVDESWPTTGVSRSSYSRHKSTVESLLDTMESPVRVVRLRPALIFQRDAGCELIRYFLGPFVPTGWLRYGRVPLVPANPALAVQAVHADDVAEAYLRALRSDVGGAFNIAAEPVLTPELVARHFHGWTLPLPRMVMTAVVAATWRARLQPVDRGWLDLAVNAPLMSTERARSELGWRASVDAVQALRELVAGVADHAHTASPPLCADPGQPGRLGGLLRGRLPGTGNPY